MLEFYERTIKVIIDDDKCSDCETFACIKACSLYDRGILKVKGGKPAILMSEEEVKRTGTECLACEFACLIEGRGAIKIEVPIPGLDEYRARWGT